MNMKIRNISVAAFALCLGFYSASAQNLDPTVVVNKAYEGKLFQVHKPSIDMAVPDSLTRFELDFDYLVSDRPYKGSDGFTPYVLDMKPVPMVEVPKKLYLNLGAGYTAHPTLDLVWSPVNGSAFKMNVYAMHRSYVGKYRSFYPEALPEGTVTVRPWSGSETGHDAWKGYDFMSKAGVDGRFITSALTAGFDVSYNGLAVKDLFKSRMYDALDVKLGLQSNLGHGAAFKYDLQVAYRYADDRLDYVAGDSERLGEHLVDVDAELGYDIGEVHQVMCDVDVDVAAYNHSVLSSVTGHASLTPRYLIRKGRWTVDAGVKIAKVVRSNPSDPVFAAKDQIVYPEVKAWFAAAPEALSLYAYIGGGNKLNTYASLLADNHHLDASSGVYAHGLMDVTVERVSASFGIEGRIGSGFSYDLRTGYVNYANALLDAIAVVPSGNAVERIVSDKYVPGVGYASYQKYYAALQWLLDTDHVRFDGGLVYTHAWNMKGAEGLFAPAALTGNLSAGYNWKKRISAGLDCDFATPRKGTLVYFSGASQCQAKIPGYVDLGVSFEYSCNRVLSVWARGGNLLNMTIQRNPLYAEKGVSATVGICLNL